MYPRAGGRIFGKEGACIGKPREAPPALADEERTTAVGLARYAYEYIDAANVVDLKEGEGRPEAVISVTPAYFLALHGIGLTLKAYLRHQGVTARELGGEKYGHNLHACYRKAKELGLLKLFREQPDDVRTMNMLIELNHHQGLRYIKTSAKKFPSWAIVYPLAVRLHQAVPPAVGYKTFTAVLGGYQ